MHLWQIEQRSKWREPLKDDNIQTLKDFALVPALDNLDQIFAKFLDNIKQLNAKNFDKKRKKDFHSAEAKKRPNTKSIGTW